MSANELDYTKITQKSEIELVSDILRDVSGSEKYRISKDSMVNIDVLFPDSSALRHRIAKTIFNKYLKNLIL